MLKGDYMLVSNTPSQNVNPNFQGNLFVQGLKLPKRKFAKVAQLFEEKTKGLPDVTLQGKQGHDFEGKFYYSTNFIINKNNNFASIITSDFKELFKSLSPKQIAEGLANISKNAAKHERVNALEKEIRSLKLKRESLLDQANAMRNNGQDSRFIRYNEVTANRMEIRITKLEIDLEKAKSEANKEIRCKGNWYF